MNRLVKLLLVFLIFLLLVISIGLTFFIFNLTFAFNKELANKYVEVSSYNKFKYKYAKPIFGLKYLGFEFYDLEEDNFDGIIYHKHPVRIEYDFVLSRIVISYKGDSKAFFKPLESTYSRNVNHNTQIVLNLKRDLKLFKIFYTHRFFEVINYIKDVYIDYIHSEVTDLIDGKVIFRQEDSNFKISFTQDKYFFNIYQMMLSPPDKFFIKGKINVFDSNANFRIAPTSVLYSYLPTGMNKMDVSLNVDISKGKISSVMKNIVNNFLSGNLSFIISTSQKEKANFIDFLANIKLRIGVNDFFKSELFLNTIKFIENIFSADKKEEKKIKDEVGDFLKNVFKNDISQNVNDYMSNFSFMFLNNMNLLKKEQKKDLEKYFGKDRDFINESNIGLFVPEIDFLKKYKININARIPIQKDPNFIEIKKILIVDENSTGINLEGECKFSDDGGCNGYINLLDYEKFFNPLQDYYMTKIKRYSSRDFINFHKNHNNDFIKSLSDDKPKDHYHIKIKYDYDFEHDIKIADSYIYQIILNYNKQRVIKAVNDAKKRPDPENYLRRILPEVKNPSELLNIKYENKISDNLWNELIK